MSESTEGAISLDCRDMRHAWERVGDHVVTEQRGRVATFDRTLGCPRCGTVRVDTYRLTSRTVERVRTKYAYPTGYRIAGGISVAEARFRLFSADRSLTRLRAV